jgi:hypothetical protein
MLKLEKNKKLLKQSRKNSRLKKEGSNLMVWFGTKKAEEEILGLFTYSWLAFSSL